MSTNPFYIITIISIALTIILSIYFYITPKGKRVSNYLLASLLLVFVCLTAHSFMISAWAYMYFGKYVKLIYFLYLFGFLTGPLTFLYIKSVSKREFKITPATIIHAIPYLFFLIISILTFVFFNLNPWGRVPVMFISASLLLTHNLYYSVRIFILLKHNYPEIFKKPTSRSGIVGWAQIFMAFYVILWFLLVNAFFVPQFILKPKWCSYTMSIYLLFFFVFMIIIIFTTLLTPDFIIEKIKNKNLGLNKQQEIDYLNRIKKHVVENKLYQDSDFRLDDLSKSLKISSRIISHVINKTQGQRFDEFINYFRIEESKTILCDNAHNKTILEIMYAVGFNSKSAFNKAFKSHTGKTPTEFRKNGSDT